MSFSASCYSSRSDVMGRRPQERPGHSFAEQPNTNALRDSANLATAPTSKTNALWVHAGATPVAAVAAIW